jgi:acetyl-CoA C-acetyltransferase
MEDVAIVGVGQSAFVRGYQGSIRELAFEAYREAMTDAQLKPKDIDASIICSAPEYDRQRTPAGVIAEYFGLTPQPTVYVENVCASGSMGVRLAYGLIKSGLHDVILILGFQKMSEVTSAESQERMGRGADILWESPFGTMMPAYYAMHARAHFEKYGTTEEDLALIRVKAAQYGQLNEKAVYRKPVTLEQVLASDPVSTPLKRFDCCANADGSSCLILARKNRAFDMPKKPVWILGLGAASAPRCAQDAARRAFGMAGIQVQDVDVAEVHDCFTIAEMMAYEDLGFAAPGEGRTLIQKKETFKDGRIPINVDGGLLSKGHPIGATGGSQIRTVVLQLRGEAGQMQVKNPKVGLIHNMGGVGLYGTVTILGG